jgi:signal peptidase I
MGTLVRLTIWLAVLFGLVVGAARLTVLRWWRVPSDDTVLETSITPTLRGGDWVLLWRASPPRFGNLVVCPDPEDAHRVVIGRIFGEDGDKVTIEGGSIRLNDHDTETESACNDKTFHVLDPNTGEDVEQGCELEALGGTLHMRGEMVGDEHSPPKSNRDVASGMVYLISDNRAYPYDSRDYGAVERATCKESIFFRLVGKGGFFDWKNRFTYIR